MNKPNSSASAREARNALLSALFVAIVSFIALVLSVYEDLAVGNSAFTLNNLLIVIPLVAALAGIALSRYRPQWASISMSVSIFISTLGTTFVVNGLGLLLAGITAITVVAISTLTLPARLLNRMVIFGAVAGMLIVFSDLFLPYDRPGPGFAIAGALPFITLGVFLGFAALIGWQFRNYSIRSKLIVAFVGLSVVSAASIAFFANLSTRASLTEAAGNELSNFAASVGQNVGDLIDKEIDLLASFSLSKAVQDRAEIASALYTTTDAAEITATLLKLDEQWRADTNESLVFNKLNDGLVNDLTQYRATFPENVEVFVTDKYGALVAATNRTSDYYQADEGWWQAAYNNGSGGIYIGQPEFDESANAYSIIMAVPISEYRNPDNIVGVLRTTVDMEAVRQTLLTKQVERGARVDLIFPGPEGAEPEIFSGEADEHEHPPHEVLEQFFENPNSYQTIDWVGEPRLVGVAPVTSATSDEGMVITNLNWLLIAHQAEAVALEPVTTTTRTIVLVSAGVLVAATVLAALFALYLSRPILHLTDVAAKVSAGDLAARATVQSDDEIGALTRTFNNTTAQLGEFIGSLEQRVAERTRALALSSDVSRRISGILEQKQLVAEVVEQIRSTFNYYHVHIYLYDEKREHLMMAGGTGEAARAMLARGHRLEEGRGLVGRSAGTNSPVLVPDVSKDPGWLPNPLLPDTKAEVAVPITSGTRVLGVLDVQHNRINDLDQDDVQLLQTIANQIAIGLQNTQSYERAQKQAERETFINTISQKIQGATRIEDVVQIAAQELGQALGAQRAVAQVSTAKITETRRV
jgi:putative methionine-R-sulfoxide reductase with GAF domain